MSLVLLVFLHTLCIRNAPAQEFQGSISPMESGRIETRLEAETEKVSSQMITDRRITTLSVVPRERKLTTLLTAGEPEKVSVSPVEQARQESEMSKNRKKKRFR